MLSGQKRVTQQLTVMKLELMTLSVYKEKSTCIYTHPTLTPISITLKVPVKYHVIMSKAF